MSPPPLLRPAHRTFFSVLLFAILAATAGAQSYTWTTLAGRRPLYGSTDGTGAGARFNLTRGLAVDATGHTYVADSDNHTIRKISPAGVVTTLGGLAGSPGTNDGNLLTSRFNFPDGLALDRAGNLFIADTGNHSIRRISPAGIISTFAGRSGVPGSLNGASTVATFNFPSGLAFDGVGNLIVADSANHTLRKVAPDGTVSVFVGTPGSPGIANGTGADARFNNPLGLAGDASGNLYVADTASHTIRKVTAAGVVTTVAGSPGLAGSTTSGTGAAARFSSPYGVVSDAAGNLLVTDWGNHCIRLVTSAGAVSTYLGRTNVEGSRDGLRTDARLFRPTGLAAAPDGAVLIADSRNLSIRRLAPFPSEDVSTLAGPGGNFGRVDGTGDDVRFNFPNGIAVDAAGTVFVADSRGNTLRRITPAGGVVTVGGGATAGYADGPAGTNLLNYPHGLALAPDGTIFFCEQQVHTIRAMLPEGTVVTVAGTNGQAGTTDAAGFAARFNLPSAIARDADGNLYIADTSNHTIRRIAARTDTVTTFAGLPGSSGSADGVGSNARFFAPRGLCTDPTGNVYVADLGNHTIRRITPAGLVTTLAGQAGTFGAIDGTLGAARFTSPSGLALDRTGRLFVADSGNQLVRILSGNTVTTIGGLAGVPGYADGPGSTARFFTPATVAVDSAGHVYVLQSGNNLVVKGTLDTPSTAGRLINLSILSDLTAPGDSFTLGYVVGGVGSVGNKPLVIRAAGPSLGALGVPETLEDPKLELFAASTKTGENDNWGGSPTLTAALANVGAFAYVGPTSKDAAVAAQIATRDNSVAVSSSNNGTGKVIAEIYDATPTASFATITPRLLNVSVRKHLGAGLTAGFVLGGDSPTTVLIRAVGPGLAAFGVPGTVVDPQLTLFNSASTKIGENNDWGGTAALTDAFARVGAFALPAVSSKDAALLVRLPPGLYTVEVSGLANTTGVALVEVYAVP